MPLDYKLFIINERIGATTRVQDASHHRVDGETTPPESAGSAIGQGTLGIDQLDSVPDLVVDSLFECWEGWVDRDSHEFSPDFEHFAYLIQAHAGHFEGGTDHRFSCETANYNLLFDTSPILTWPTDLALGDPSDRYPAGHSVTDWLVGRVSDGKPFEGLIPFHFPGGVDFGGVDPVYDTIILDAAHMPTMSNVNFPENYGEAGFTLLRDWIDEVMKYAKLAARDMGLTINPTYFMRTIIDPADPTALCAQFCCRDQQNDAGTGDIAAVYSTTPGPGGYLVGYPLVHERDAKSVQTEVIVMADGDRAEGFIWSAKHSTAGAALYPTRFHRRGFWGGAPLLNADLTTQAQTDDYAQTVADIKWGPRGQLSFYADGPRNLKVGDFVELNIPAEGQDHHVVPVLSIDRSHEPGIITMHLTVGERTIELGDILIPRADAPMLTTGGGNGSNAQGTAAGQWVGGAGASGTPRQRPLTNVATTNKRNVVQGVNNAVTALTIRQNPAAAPAVGDSPTVPAPADIAVLASRWSADETAWYKTVWADQYGTPHKQKLAFAWAADGTVPFAVAERMTIRSVQAPTDPAQAGTTFSISINAAGTETVVATVTSGVLSDPFEVLPGQQLEVTATDTAGLTSLTLVSGDPL